MDAAERSHLRRLRRRAAKLGNFGMRVDILRRHSGYWLVDARTDSVVAPLGGGFEGYSLDRIEKEIEERE